jgi:hypothetical protein
MASTVSMRAAAGGQAPAARAQNVEAGQTEGKTRTTARAHGMSRKVLERMWVRRAPADARSEDCDSWI